MQRFIITILFVVLLTQSCVTKKRCSAKFPPAQSIYITTDSVKIIEITKDSISYFTDSSYVVALLECNEQGKVILKELQDYKSGSKLDVPKIIIKENVITANCVVDSIEVYNRIKTKQVTVVSNKQKETTKTVNVLTPFQKFRCNAFWYMSAILLVILLVIIKKSIYGNKKI